MNGLLSNSVKDILEKIVTYCFYTNRKLDRIMSVISVKFVMPNTEKILHSNLAHLYPGLSDIIVKYMDSRDSMTTYGETPRGDEEYTQPLECFNKALEMQLELESLVKDGILTSEKDGDFTTMVFLQNFLKNLIPITADILLLVDKAEYYGEDPKSWMRFDKDILVFPLFKED